MPSKQSTRFTVKHFAKQVSKKLFGMKHFTVKRPMAIGVIIVCIVGTAMLIVARSSEPTSAASVPEKPIVALAPIQQTTFAKAQPSTISAKLISAQTAGAVAGTELATIEGCLIHDDGQFRLKNTAGEDAPKRRSWKSGFLHRSSKTIEVLDESRRLNLARHLGERVTITGLLDDRDLQGTSLKRIAESCT